MDPSLSRSSMLGQRYPLWNDAWRLEESLLETMRDEVQSHGARFVVVTLSNGIQVWPDAAARAVFLKRIDAKDIFYPDRRIRDFCNQNHIEEIALAPEMQRYADENKVFLHGLGKELGNGHWNSEGHRLAAELTARNLCDILILKHANVIHAASPGAVTP